MYKINYFKGKPMVQLNFIKTVIVTLVTIWAFYSPLANAKDEVSEDEYKNPVIFQNVNIIPMTDSEITFNQDVFISDKKIIAVGATGSIPFPENTKIIDGKDAYLMPGLSDMHAHWWDSKDDSALFLKSGVTTIFSLGEFPWVDMIPLREKSRASDYIGPTLFTSGRRVESWDNNTLENVIALVDENAEKGFDAVKIHGQMSSDTYDKMSQRAKELGIKVTGHAQRQLGMSPTYKNKHDIAHGEEYLYAAFIPNRPFQISGFTMLAINVLGLIMVFTWNVKAWIRKRKNQNIITEFSSKKMKRKYGFFCLISWAFLVMLMLSVPPIFGIWAGKMWATLLVSLLSVTVVLFSASIIYNTFNAFRDKRTLIKRKLFFGGLSLLAFIFSISSLYTLPGVWRTTDSGLEQIAQETADAGIWVTPNLVAYDYLGRNTRAESIVYPNSKYLTLFMRQYWQDASKLQLWTVLSPLVMAAFDNQLDLLQRLTAKMHQKGVPMLSGTDAGLVGVLPGLSTIEELKLLVESGLTPYQALKIATINAAKYLEVTPTFGSIQPQMRADLLLLKSNPLLNIDNVSKSIGVMVKGHWLTKEDLEKNLKQLVKDRK